MQSRYSPRILVVDDEFTVRRLTSVLLKRTGYAVDSAADGQKALGQIETKGIPSLAIVDLMMPVMDGQEFVEHARSRGWWFPTILASASFEAPEIARDLGLQGFLAKPYDVEQLVSTIRRVLACEERMIA